MPDLATDLDAFLADLLTAGRAPATALRHRQRLVVALRIFAERGCLRAADCTPADVDAYMQHLRERGQALTTREGSAASLRVFWIWLMRHGRALVDPTLDIMAPSGEPPLPAAPLSEAEVAALLDGIPRRTVHDLSLRAHLELMYGCGLRLQESLDLHLTNWRGEDQTLLVRGKFGHERILPVMPSASAVLADYLALRRSLLRGPDLGVLFLGHTGQAVVGVTFAQWLGRLSERVLGEGRHVNPHLLRHSVAVHLLRGGADIRYVQEFLGHTDMNTTMIYLRMIPGHLREDYDKAMPELAGEVEID